MSVCDPGCVKTPTSNLQVESLSRLRRIRKEPLWQSPSKEEKRENNSAHSLLVHVFTQPRPDADIKSRFAPFPFPWLKPILWSVLSFGGSIETTRLHQSYYWRSCHVAAFRAGA